MKVAVVCFGAMRDHLPAGASSNRADVEVAEGATVGDVVDVLGAPRRLAFAVLVDGRRATLDDPVADGSEVTLMPPFAGGASGRRARSGTASTLTDREVVMARAGKEPGKLTSFNPATGRVLGEVPATPVAEVAEIVGRARKVAPEWGTLAPEARVRMMRAVRHRIYDLMDDIIATVSAECGKPPAEALAHDILPAVLTLQYYERTAARTLRADRAGRLIGPVFGLSSRIEYRPFGVVGCISPWNYPFFLAVMALAPPLFAGNAVVVKPSEVTPTVGERLRDVLDPLPPGVATVVQGAGDVGAALVDAPCDKLCFIGSGATGRKIAAAAARHLTPVVMELGGQDAAVVCADADLDLASSGVLWGAFLNAGQTCCAIERVYVAEPVADEFEELLVAKAARLRRGEEVGSITAPRQLETVERHVADAIGKGARLLSGGTGRWTGDDGSLWFAPTILSGRTEDMTLFAEETFGPVLPVVRVRDEDEAVRRASEEGFNLTASVWSRSRARAESVAARLRAGTISLNDHASTAGASWGAWGGAGESGYGRLHGVAGLREFVMPVHVARNISPRLKRLWWYPYDDHTRAALRATADILAAPGIAPKLGAAKTLAANVVQALRAKV